jgi:translation initiation factor 2 beta subunit (eIF-2beta)/eIF-5
MHNVIEVERKIENQLRVRNRIKFHNSEVRKYISDNTLSGKQKKDIDSVYKKYVGKWKYDFHEFYSQKTGVFSPYYIPDDLYYGYVDLFFNNWEAANYIDNKCYYDMLFPEFKQPETIAKRINNFWCIDGKIVSFNETVSYISNNKCGRVFIKKATDSHGGGGCSVSRMLPKHRISKKL